MKKGFTLIELISVLMIISLLLVIIIPNVQNSGNSANEKMYNTKVESIYTAYKLCVSDGEGESNCNKVKNLISKKYLLSDDVTSNTASTCTSNCIKNPKSGGYLDDCTINVSGNTYSLSGTGCT